MRFSDLAGTINVGGDIRLESSQFPGGRVGRKYLAAYVALKASAHVVSGMDTSLTQKVSLIVQLAGDNYTNEFKAVCTFTKNGSI